MGEFHQPYPGTFVRVGAPADSVAACIDTTMLAVMEFAPKAELLDEIFADNQGAGNEQFNRVHIFKTKSRFWVYQVESPKGYSKYWWPYDPRYSDDDENLPPGKMIRAEIPKGTIVGVGVVGSNTRWYIASTYGKGGLANRRLPPTWRVEVVPELPATDLPGTIAA